MSRTWGVPLGGCIAVLIGVLSSFASLPSARASEDAVDLKEALRRLEGGKSAVREKAARDIGTLGPAASTAAPALVKALRDDDYSVREASAAALGSIGVKSDPVLRGLEKALKDPWPRAQIAAATSLGKLAPEGSKGLPILITYLAGSPKDLRAREAAVRGLIPYGPRAAEAVPTLTEILKDGRDLEKGSAMEALGAIGAKALPALPSILVHVGAQDHYLSTCAIGAVGGIGPEAAETGVPALEVALKRARELESGRILESLGKLGSTAIPVLEGFLRAPGRKGLDCGPAIEALGTIGKDAVPALERLLGREDSFIVNDTVKALRKAGVSADRLIPLLAAALDRNEMISGFSLASALASFGEAAVPALVDVLRGGKRNASLFALQALDAMGNAARGAIPTLEEVATSTDKVLAVQAKETLRKLRETAGK